MWILFVVVLAVAALSMLIGSCALLLDSIAGYRGHRRPSSSASSSSSSRALPPPDEPKPECAPPPPSSPSAGRDGW